MKIEVKYRPTKIIRLGVLTDDHGTYKEEDGTIKLYIIRD